MNIATLIANLLSLINGYIIPFLVALAILAFFWGIIKYIWSGGGGEEKSSAIRVMSAGIIGLVVMLSVWGIVNLVSNSLGIGGSTVVQLPRVQ